MLAPYWRLRVLNSTDQILTYANAARVNVRMRPWKLVSGVLTYGSSIIDDMGFTTGTIAIDGESEGDAQDNTSNLYWGIAGFFEVIADADSTDGTVYLYLEESDDDTNWPSDAADFDIEKHMTLIAALELSTDAVDEDASMNFII
ncbi:MAG: hypothetical protein KAS15_00895 [Nanoarchaeota archaeon]|nr:hypothetical protein [Nanoarchaeota archaeon]